MRAKKVEGLTIAWNPGDELGGSGYYDEIWAVNKPTTRYYYDGQMCVEEDYTYDNGGTPGLDLTRYGVGARGIDLIERIVNQGAPSVTFPLYDGHGNMTATLSRSGASFTVSNQRSYDVWGGVRSGATSGFPNTRYVANLGHKQDDESDLIYMRARYYEPWTGRFISEDPARDGGNWFVYAASNPVANIDADGRSAESEILAAVGDILKLVGFALASGAALDIQAVGAWTSLLQRAWRTARAVGEWYRADIIRRTIYLLHAIRKSQVWRSARMRLRTAEFIVGYMMIIEGYLFDVDAEFLDPYAPNEGLSRYL